MDLHLIGRLWWPSPHYLVPLLPVYTQEQMGKSAMSNIYNRKQCKIKCFWKLTSITVHLFEVFFIPSSSPIASLILASKSSPASLEDSTSSEHGTRFFVLNMMSVCSCSLNWIWKSPSFWASHLPWVVLPDPRGPRNRIRRAGGLDRNILTIQIFYTVTFYLTYRKNLGLYLEQLCLCNKLCRILKEGIPGF